MPGTTGVPAAIASSRAAVLLPIAAIASAGGPIHTSPASRTARGEPFALGEKSVAGMNRLGAGQLRRFDDPVAAQIALARRRRPDEHRFVGLAHVRRARVGVGVDGDRRDAQLAAGADDPQRDLAAVGDQDLLEHQSGMFPCFFGGFRSRFVRSVSSASIRRGRVSRGSMMSST